MSLNFGVYLVEQRIITPEQFCGLVKIQQEAAMSLASIAIRKNVMTIKQVSRVLDVQEGSQASFIQTALAEELIDSSDAEVLLHEQQRSCPPIRKLVVECGLLTTRQSFVLFNHFEKLSNMKHVPAATKTQDQAQPQAAPQSDSKQSPRKPKFTQRPVIVQPYSSQIQQ